MHFHIPIRMYFLFASVSCLQHHSIMHLKCGSMKSVNQHPPSSSRATPFLLVGTKTDLRTNLPDVELLAKSKQKPITREQGERAAKEYGAYAYIECSSLTQENLKETFDTAILAALTPLPSKTCCNSMLLFVIFN